MYANYLKGSQGDYKDQPDGIYRGFFGIRELIVWSAPKELCTNDIVRYVRAMGNRTGGAVVALHRIVDEKAEALEIQGVGKLPGPGPKSFLILS